MKRVLRRTNLLIVALVSMFVACITCATTMLVSAATEQEEEPIVRKVELTSYTSVMNVDEEFEFSAIVTYEDGSTSTEVTWASSDTTVLAFTEGGWVYAYSAGNAKITATAGEVSASIDVLVSDEAVLVQGVTIDPAEVSLYPRETYALSAVILPEDATDKTVTWKSNDESVATVDADGVVTAVAAGNATITVTTNDHMYTSTCAVTVIAYGEASMNVESLSLHLDEIGELTVTPPEGITVASYAWSSSVPAVATPAANAQDTAEIDTWSFGTTTIFAVITDTNGDKYEARATVLVTADYFYLVGMNDVWDTYDTEAGAEGAGVLLAPVEGKSNVYSITRSVWAYQNFQIIHSGIDAAWTSKITPYWYSAEGSTAAYVANEGDYFRVTAYGAYTITLDLNDGEAKVFIEMQDVYATEINFKFTDDTTAILTAEKDTAVISVEILPENATYNPEDVKVVVTDSTMTEDTEGASEYVTSTYDAETKTITVKAVKFPETGAVTIYVTVSVNENDVNVANASNTVRLQVASATAVAPKSIAFTQAVYPLDLNNGGNAWTTTVTATVDAEADLDLVRYSTTESAISVDPLTGEVSASALGVYTVTATAVGDTSVTNTAQVVVYSSAFYLIGTLEGTTPNNWIALDNKTYQSLDETAFAKWGLTAVDGSLTEYTGEFDLDADDLFSIVFLGMDPGSWYAAVNSSYFDAESSTEYAIVDGTNVKILANGTYRVNLTLDSKGPHFNVELVHLEDVVPYDLHVYLMRAGDAWDSSASAVGNVLVDGGYINVNGESGKSVTFTYDFNGMTPWAVFQFLTAPGTEGGFADATWYGSDATTGITITGDAVKETYEEGETDFFTNGGSGCQFWYVGDMTSGEIPLVEFTITFNAAGRISGIEINFVETPSVD